MSLKRDSNSVESTDDEPFLAKRIRLEHILISEKINKNYPDIDISQHEINKFPLIFSTLLETLNDATKSTDAEDRIQDVILTVGRGLLKLLKGNMDSLKLLAVLKNTLKRLKSFLFLINNKVDGADKNDSKNSLRDGDKFKEDNRQQHTDELDLELKTLKEEYVIKFLK